MNANLQTISNADELVFSHGVTARSASDYLARSGTRTNEGRRRGRGAGVNPSGRFETLSLHICDDGWQTLDELPAFKTSVQKENSRTIISRNNSPDLNFDQSINPYRGCEHGCVYCFARPTHSYMGLSAGLDFESKLFAKPNAARLLQREISKSSYKVKNLAIGTNTDPYQPIEKQWRITRSILETLDDCNHPVGIVTKSALVTRDIDILARMAERGLARVAISMTSMDRKLSRTMEPRASSPALRLEAIRKLSDAGIPVSVMVAPLIPALNDHEMERILDAAYANGARHAGFIMLRLPLEVSGIFKDWLLRHYPDRYRHVLSLLRSMHGGKDYDAEFSTRMKGKGPYAWQTGRRFEMATKRLGFTKKQAKLRTDLFRKPQEAEMQLSLF